MPLGKRLRVSLRLNDASAGAATSMMRYFGSRQRPGGSATNGGFEAIASCHTELEMAANAQFGYEKLHGVGNANAYLVTLNDFGRDTFEH